VQIELVDLAGVEKRCDELAAAHHPDVLSFRSAQPACDHSSRFRRELDAGQRALGRLSREDVVRCPCIEHGGPGMFPYIAERPIVRPAAEQYGVDVRDELRVAVVDGMRSSVEPFDVAIGARDETVGADGEIGDDLSFSFHRRLRVIVYV
jgi:hypothetical protein